MPTGKMRVKGVQGSGDAKRIQEALRDVWGIREVALREETGEVSFAYNEKAASYDDFKQALTDIGYEVEDVNRHAETEVSRYEM